MRRRREWLGALALTACMLAPAIVFAQQPWIVTVTPTLNPLPIGLCGAIQLTILDASGKDVPRNPRGFRVTMADFDIAVSGRSVVGRQIDPTHFEACACQGGAPGSAAGVTATYPARALSESDRVPGIALQAIAAFTLAAAKGAINPPACITASAAPAPAPAVPPAAVALPPGPVAGTAIPGAAVGRERPYAPGPVTVSFSLSANGSWYEPGPMTITFGLSAQGSWYEPGQVTVAFDLSATGNWKERSEIPAAPLQPAPPGP